MERTGPEWLGLGGGRESGGGLLFLFVFVFSRCVMVMLLSLQEGREGGVIV